MKKIFFMGVMGLFLLGSCSNHSGHSHEGHNHDHEGHNHATEEHAHSHEGHSHDHEGHTHEAHNHEGHDHAAEAHTHEGHNHEAHEHNHVAEAHNHEDHNHDSHAGYNHEAEAHNHDSHEGHDHGHAHGVNPDEIMLAPAKAKAAGVVSVVIQPKPFRQIIKASGEVQAAQGNESIVVANVSGIVSFQRSVTEGMQVGKGASLMTISASKLQEGDPAERARIAYEAAKAEYDRASRLVESQIVSQKEFVAIKEKYENAKLAYEALAKNQTKNGVSVISPMGGYIKNLMVKE